ncbi:MAG: hypothetical protein ABSB87_05685 [Terriglobales bacterium]|jgi:hypothetical protein
MFQRLSIALFAVVLSTPLSSAQMGGAMGRAASGAHTGFARSVRGGIGRRYGARPFNRGILVSSPFFDSDYDYSDYDTGDPYAVGTVESDVSGLQPKVVVVRPASVHDSPRQTKATPLLIEWQGDRYVRFGGADASAERGTSARPDYAEPANPPASAAQKHSTEARAAELPPVVLVYRDGRREEVADYTIADGIIYLRGNDWQNGYWTKHIPLSALDSLATMQVNQKRGVKFMLPSAPNVVIASF